MKAALSVLLCLAVALLLSSGIEAQEKKADKGKEVTLKGNVTCAKCELKETDSCKTVIQVKEGDKSIVYYFDNAAHKKHHTTICKEGKQGTVKGTVAEKDGKKIVTVKDLKFE